MSLESTIKEQARFNDPIFSKREVLFGRQTPTENSGILINFLYDVGSISRYTCNATSSLYSHLISSSKK
ncbi:MAG: hypothetical protein VX028_02505 [Nanoarchaeota archaeon]|nr:hypothetical protein [Nanoarchaeota archaeon]